MMCHAVMGCETLGQAMARYCRFYQLFEFGVNPNLEVSEDEVTLRVTKVDDSVEPDPYMIELLLFNAHRYFSWLVQEHLPVQQVELAYAGACL